jgi:membrane-associated phospholipid phosphatase
MELVAGPDMTKRAFLWLAILIPSFALTYGGALVIASLRHPSATLATSWDRFVPFVPWTVWPYLTFDLLYCASLFFNTSKEELDRHGLRLLAAQAICVAAFVAFPMRYAFVRPPTYGINGALFRLIDVFDRPFNQAPSLHIANLVIVWACLMRHARGLWSFAVHGWMILIGVSTLTTYQHHLVDVPSGALVGILVLLAIPIRTPQTSYALTRE